MKFLGKGMTGSLSVWQCQQEPVRAELQRMLDQHVQHDRKPGLSGPFWHDHPSCCLFPDYFCQNFAIKLKGGKA